MTFINADEAIKRLAAAQGIDVLNLVKSVDERQDEADAAAEQEQQMAALQQAPQLMKAPMMDPSKNPNAEAIMADALSPE